MGLAGAVTRFALIAGLLAGCAHQRPARADQAGEFHTVQKGETLYRISRASGVPVAVLLRENALTDARQLKVGERLFIPRAHAAVVKPAPKPAPVVAAQPRTVVAAQPRTVAVARAEAAARRPEGRLAWPVKGVLFSPFGHRARDQHDGIDLAAPEGTPVRSAESGTVLFVGKQRGYGNLVLVGHGGGLVTVYAHNQKNLVSAGDRVGKGDVIARVGRTGTATGPHLHFEVRVAARPQDPMHFLR